MKEGNTDELLVCDNCDFYCCHIGCLDPPIDYIPKSEWYCDHCLRENPNLKNKFERPLSVIFPESFQQILDSPNQQNSPKNVVDGIANLPQEAQNLHNVSNSGSAGLQQGFGPLNGDISGKHNLMLLAPQKCKRRGRRKGKMKNPLAGLNETIQKTKNQEKIDRKNRAEKRRQIELGEQGSLSRRRRFRIRESKRKKRRRGVSKSEQKMVKKDEIRKVIKKRVMPFRKSKSLSIDKYVKYVKHGVDVRSDFTDSESMAMKKTLINRKVVQQKKVLQG